MIGALLAAAVAAEPADGAAPALRPLLALTAAADTPLAAGSSCGGAIPGVRRPTLGALLASRLAYLDAGENRVTGGCEAGACKVEITHAAGEDVASAQFRFRLKAGRLDPKSLSCILTP